MQWLTSDVQVWQLVLVAVGLVAMMVVGWVKDDEARQEIGKQIKKLTTQVKDVDDYVFSRASRETVSYLSEGLGETRKRVTELEERSKRVTCGPLPSGVPYDDFHRLEKMVYQLRERSFNHRVARWLGVE